MTNRDLNLEQVITIKLQYPPSTWRSNKN